METVRNTSARAVPGRTAPIPIPMHSPNNASTTEYSLKQNFFDPNKSSPPNSWNTRLLQRLGDYEEKRPWRRITE